VDRNTISLIGVVDALKHLLDHDKATRKNRRLRAASKRLESIRQELLAEGLRHGKILGAARDYVLDISAQLEGHLVEQRDLRWVLHELQSVSTLDMDPPPPPPSSSDSRPS
jgi:hypothetical protein